MGLPLDGYVRVSKVGGREGEGFISPDVQERAIREWAERSGVAVVMQPHELDVSGGTMDRPVFNRISMAFPDCGAASVFHARESGDRAAFG